MSALRAWAGPPRPACLPPVQRPVRSLLCRSSAQARACGTCGTARCPVGRRSGADRSGACARGCSIRSFSTPPVYTNAGMPLTVLALCSSNLETLQPGFGLEGVDGVHKSYHTGLGRHYHRVRPGSTPEVLNSLQGLARRHAGRREDHVVAPYQVVEGELALRVVEAILSELLDLRALCRPHPGLHLAPEALHDRRREDAIGCPSYTENRVQVGPTHPHS